MIISAMLLAAMVPLVGERLPNAGTTIRLKLPDEITPSMGPYRDCKLQAVGAIVTGLDGKKLPKMAKRGGDCTPYRIKAVADADVALRALGKTDPERSAEIAKAVEDIDNFAAELKRLQGG